MLLLPVGLQKKGFTPLRPIKKNNVKSALKNCIICRIIELSCRIVSLENAAKFAIVCRTLSEAQCLADCRWPFEKETADEEYS